MVPPWRIDPTSHRTKNERSYHGPERESLFIIVIIYLFITSGYISVDRMVTKNSFMGLPTVHLQAVEDPARPKVWNLELLASPICEFVRVVVVFCVCFFFLVWLCFVVLGFVVVMLFVLSLLVALVLFLVLLKYLISVFIRTVFLPNRLITSTWTPRRKATRTRVICFSKPAFHLSQTCKGLAWTCKLMVMSAELIFLKKSFH